MSFSPRKSLRASSAHSHSLADLEPRQVTIALIFWGLKSVTQGKNEQKGVARNRVAGFSGWPKPGWQKILQRRLWLCPVLGKVWKISPGQIPCMVPRI